MPGAESAASVLAGITFLTAVLSAVVALSAGGTAWSVRSGVPAAAGSAPRTEGPRGAAWRTGALPWVRGSPSRVVPSGRRPGGDPVEAHGRRTPGGGGVPRSRARGLGWGQGGPHGEGPPPPRRTRR